MRFTHDGQHIEIFSANIDYFGQKRKLDLVGITSRNPNFLTFIFELYVDDNVIKFEVSYMHDNMLESINVLDEEQTDLFDDYLSEADFEIVKIF